MKTPTPPRKKRSRSRTLFLIFFAVGALFLLGTLTLSLCLGATVSPEMDEALFLKAGSDSATHFYYNADKGGGYLPVEWEEERLYAGQFCLRTPISEIPPILQNAFVGMEDHRFYSHGGVDVIRTARAAFEHLFGESAFGGSTITQQLIKNIGGDRERTVKRKLKEMYRAMALEARHEKEEILEAYLNIVPMGDGCIGVGAAASRYFGKSPSELTLAEAASLAAITPAPARLNPRADPEKHLLRRNLVLDRMATLGYITEEERTEAQKEPVSLAEKGREEKAPASWYTEHVLSEVYAALVDVGYTESTAKALLYGGGLHIYTAADKDAQAAAENAVANERFTNLRKEDLHAGVAIFSPATGKLVALVGDLGEKAGSRLLNYATDIRRAPGSALKPLALYAPAIEEGRITEATLFDDAPVSFSDGAVWPHNTPDRFDGLILAKDALAHSKNTVAVSLYRTLGAEHIYATLKEKFRISGLCRRASLPSGAVATDLAEAPLALGELTYGVSPFELTRAYLPFASGGEMTKGSSYYRVEDSEGRVLLSSADMKESVLSSATASVMTHMLCGAVEEGSAKSLTLSELVDTAGKTGSSGGNRDRWFVGYTPYYLCGVWCGYESGGKAVSGAPHLSLFDGIMKPLHRSLDEESLRSFGRAAGIKEMTVCMDSGKMQTNLCKEDARGHRETTVWVPAHLHLGSCDIHVSVFYDEENDGVVYPPEKGREGKLKRVSLLHVPWRSFPTEVVITDAEYVYRDPAGSVPPEGDLPFFAGAIPKGVYIGKSHDGRPYNAAARAQLPPPFLGDAKAKKGTENRLPIRPLPILPRRRLPRFSFFGF